MTLVSTSEEFISLTATALLSIPRGRDVIGGDLRRPASPSAVAESSIGIETVDVEAATDLGIDAATADAGELLGRGRGDDGVHSCVVQATQKVLMKAFFVTVVGKNWKTAAPRRMAER